MIVCIEQPVRYFWDHENRERREVRSFGQVSVPPHGYGQRGKFDIPLRVLDPDGNQRCRWCFGQVKPPRRSWCSQKCVDEYLSRADWNWIRQQIIDRDKVCQFCGGSGAVIRPVGFRGPDGLYSGSTLYSDEGGLACMFSIRIEWEVDHIISVSDGGTDDPINLRLLCVPCHRRRTKLWHQQRAERSHGQLSWLEAAT